jgi:hypothetical protein
MLIMGLVAAASTNTAAATYCTWDAATRKKVCYSNLSEFSQPYSSNSYVNPYYSNSYYNPYSASGYTFFRAIYTTLCGWQYNTFVNFDYNCANDIPAW